MPLGTVLNILVEDMPSRKMKKSFVIAVVIVMATILVPALLLVAVGQITGIFVISPWSRRYFVPTDPTTVYGAQLDVRSLRKQLSPCNLIWTSVLRGEQETKYSSGPDYIFSLTPISLDGHQLASWNVSISSFSKNGTLIKLPGDGLPTVFVPAEIVDPYPEEEDLVIYRSFEQRFGSFLTDIAPGDRIVIGVDIAVKVAGSDENCLESQRFEFVCNYESGVFRSYR